MSGQRSWMGMNCSLSLPAWELEAIDEGTKHVTDNRMWFLEMVEENGRNMVNCQCREGLGAYLGGHFCGELLQRWTMWGSPRCVEGWRTALQARPARLLPGDVLMDTLAGLIPGWIIPFTHIVVVRLLVVHGFSLAPLILAAPFVRRKCRKIILQPVECFRGVLAGPLLCSCSVQKLIPGSLKNGFWCWAKVTERGGCTWFSR